MDRTTRTVVLFRIFHVISIAAFALSDPNPRGFAIAAESSKPAIHVQQPNPFSSPGEKWIEITDHQGQKMVIREKGQEIKQIAQAKGSVIMIRGDVVTIRLDQKERPASIGDRVELSYSVDGEVIPVGTWRVSVLKEDGTLEAEPVEMKGKPNIGMDAVLFAKEERPQPVEKPKPSEKEKGSATYQQPEPKGKEKTSAEKEPKPKSLDEILASYSKTAVPISLTGAGESLPCDSDTIRIHKDKVEMSASGESKWEHCIFKVSDELFKNFFATFKLTVDTNSHHHFHAGIVYGIKPGGVHESDSIRGNILALSSKTSSGLFQVQTVLFVPHKSQTSFKRRQKSWGDYREIFTRGLQSDPRHASISEDRSNMPDLLERGRNWVVGRRGYFQWSSLA